MSKKIIPLIAILFPEQTHALQNLDYNALSNSFNTLNIQSATLNKLAPNLDAKVTEMKNNINDALLIASTITTLQTSLTELATDTSNLTYLLDRISVGEDDFSQQNAIFITNVCNRYAGVFGQVRDQPFVVTLTTSGFSMTIHDYAHMSKYDIGTAFLANSQAVSLINANRINSTLILSLRSIITDYTTRISNYSDMLTLAQNERTLAVVALNNTIKQNLTSITTNLTNMNATMTNNGIT